MNSGFNYVTLDGQFTFGQQVTLEGENKEKCKNAMSNGKPIILTAVGQSLEGTFQASVIMTKAEGTNLFIYSGLAYYGNIVTVQLFRNQDGDIALVFNAV